MKTIIILSALMTAFGFSMAQEVKTYSVYDSNQSGTISVEDVTATVEQVKNDVAATSTQQYVTAEDLSTMFGTILSKLNSLESDIAVIKEKLEKEDPSARFNGHDYIDLGITDADGKTIYWATCNVGATSPEEYGDYFAWGETTTKSTYDWSTYTLCGGTSNTMTKYCTSSEYGTVDNNTVLEPTDDAATANWGGSWRIPTYAELKQLGTECYWAWVTSYNGKSVNGYVVYKAKAAADKGKHPYYDDDSDSFVTPTPIATYSSASDAHIFLPAAGFRNDSDLFSASSYGAYWSRSLCKSMSDCAYFFYFYSSTVFWKYHARCSGQSVRPVCQ